MKSNNNDVTESDGGLISRYIDISLDVSCYLLIGDYAVSLEMVAIPLGIERGGYISLEIHCYAVAVSCYRQSPRSYFGDSLI